MTLEEKAEAFVANLKGLGYEKRNTGLWNHQTVDTGSGFPDVTYVCPFCKYESHEPTNYCPICGARLENE